MFKCSLALSFFVLASASFASFDMALIAMDDGPEDSRIERFDPINRISLGSFGQGILSRPTAVAVKGQVAYVADRYVSGATSIHQFNFNTGELLSTQNFAGVINNMEFANNGDLLLCGLTFAGRYSATTLAQIQAITPYVNNEIYDIFEDGIGHYHLATRNTTSNGTYITTHGPTGSALNFLQIGIYATGGGSHGINIARGAGNTFLATTGNLLNTGVSTSFHTSYTWNGTNFVQTNLTQVTGSTGLPMKVVPLADAAFGHGTQVWGLNRTELGSGSGIYSNRISSMNLTNSTYRSAMDAPAGEMVDIAMVLAPEPGSVFALALGTLLVLRRRTR